MDILFVILVLAFTALAYIIPTLIILGIILMLVSWIVDKNADPYDLSDDVGDYYCPICKDTTDWCSHGP